MADEDIAADIDVELGNPPKRRCVTLAGGRDCRPDDEEDSVVVIGNCVAANAVKRSGLLSGIDKTEGLASLPGHISPEDVRLWEAACAVDVYPPTDELVTVMKVADALGDRNDNRWATKLANRAAHANWADSSQADALLCTLLRLPPHLLHRVLSSCLKIVAPEDILKRFPQPLHLAIVSAMFPTGALHIKPNSAEPVLSHLPSIPSPHHALTHIKLSSPDSVKFSAASGALLARAAAAHTTLSCLGLMHAVLPPRWLRSFTECLSPGALPRLSTLSIHLVAHPGGCAELAACLRLLPALTRLELTYAHKHSAARTEESLFAFARHAATPARLPALVRLSITEPPSGQRGKPQWDSSVHALLSIINAPVLELLTLFLCPSGFRIAGVMEQVNSTRFPALQSIEFNAALTSKEAQGPLVAQRKAGGTLPALRSIYLSSACQASLLVMAAAAVCKADPSTLTGLTLSLSADGSPSYDDCLPRAAFESSWQPSLSVLGTCDRLEYLSLQLCSGMRHAKRAMFSEALHDALVKLTHLKCLCLVACCGAVLPATTDAHLSGSVVGSAMSTLTDLQSLRIDEGDSGVKFLFDAVQPVLDACSKLARLTELQLCFEGVTVPLVSALIPKLPALVSVTVPGRMDDGAGGAFAAMTALFPLVQFIAQA